MDLIRERPYVLWVGLLGASLLVAIAFYFFFPPTQTERILFFPENITGALKGEERLVPKEATLEENVRILVRELLLGPEQVRDLRVVPVNTTANSVIVRDNHAYLDFSPEMVAGSSDLQEPTDKAIRIIEHTIRYNFPSIRAITVTIGGQLSGEPYFSIK